MEPTRRGQKDRKEPDGYAGLILILLIVVVIIAASWPALFPSDSAAADRLPIFLSIGPNGEEGATSGLRLSIITDFFQSLFGGSSGGTYRLSQNGGTLGSVRTLPPEYTDTPSGIVNAGDFTATPTETLVAFGTVGPSPTPSPTGTPGPTKAGTDTKDPQISGGSMSPASGATISCSTNVSISGLRVRDPDFSSGMNHVQLKYQIEGSGFVYGPELTRVSGGFTGPGKTWDAIYDGGIKIDYDSGSDLGAIKVYALPLVVQATDAATATPTATDTASPTAAPDTPTPTSAPSITPTASATSSPTPTWTPDPTPRGPYRVEVYAYVEDNAGNTAVMHVATYWIPASCG